MRILHVASFSGNIGDNANHNGLRSQLAKAGIKNAFFTEVEIRRFYKNCAPELKLSFDSEFAKLANAHDLTIIGGGNFFEICHEYSSTGCTIDMPRKVLDEISKPLVFFGLGFDIHKGASDSAKKKFAGFIEGALGKKNTIVSFRNDGSHKNFFTVYGQLPSDILRVPDGGFFLDLGLFTKPSWLPENYVVANIACDMANLRFRGLNETEVAKYFGEYFNQVALGLGVNIVLVPHIYSDLQIVAHILNHLSDSVRRTQVTVAPYVMGHGSEISVFQAYALAELSIGMRFHANVCPIGLGVPTIGLVTYPKLMDLYEDLNLQTRAILFEGRGTMDELFVKTKDSFSDSASIRTSYRNLKLRLEKDLVPFLNQLENLL